MTQENLGNRQGKYDRIKQLHELMTDWSDEVPQEVLHGGDWDNSGKFKVRKNWWAGFIGIIENLVWDNRLPDDLAEEVRKFVDIYTFPTFHHRLTTKEDIDAANKLAVKIFKALE